MVLVVRAAGEGVGGQHAVRLETHGVDSRLADKNTNVAIAI